MSSPNKTVGKWRSKVGFPDKEPRPIDPFFEWFFDQVQNHGRLFDSMEIAREEFLKINQEKA